MSVDTASSGTVAVVGAGITGLAAGWAVRQAGRPVIVLEASDRVGGVVDTLEEDGYRIERGPSSLMGSETLERLLDATALTDARVTPSDAARRRYVVAHGRPAALPAGPLAALAAPHLSLPGKLRALVEPLVTAAPEDAPDETLADLVRRRFGAEVLDALVDPVVSGVYAGDAERLSARHVLRPLHAMERRHGSVVVGALRSALSGPRAPTRRSAIVSFGRGLAQLPDTLASALGGAVHRRTRVVALRRDEDGWTVAAERDGCPEQHRVAAVVLAAPAHALAAIEAEPALRASLARVAAVPHAPIATVALGFRREDVAHPLDGFGVLVPSREGLDLLGVLFSSSVFPDRAPAGHVLLTCYLGGARRPDLAGEPLERVEQRALAAVRPLLGVRGAPTLVCGTRWTPGIPQYEVGHDAVLEAATRAETCHPGLALAGSWRDGVSLGDCVAGGLAAGARAVRGGAAGTAAFDAPFQAVR